MVRRYGTGRPVPPEVVDRIVRNGLRAPSAGFAQGWGFLVLNDPADIARSSSERKPMSQTVYQGRWGHPAG